MVAWRRAGLWKMARHLMMDFNLFIRGARCSRNFWMVICLELIPVVDVDERLILLMGMAYNMIWVLLVFSHQVRSNILEQEEI